MRNRIAVSFLLILLAACVGPPRDATYCQAHGEQPGTESFAKCIDYFRTQEALFGGDLAFCEREADRTYPPALYDYGQQRLMRTQGGVGYGRMGEPHYYYPESVIIEEEPDYQHNAMLDDLRLRIIEPCMQSKGWNSSESWELGRNEPVKKKKGHH